MKNSDASLVGTAPFKKVLESALSIATEHVEMLFMNHLLGDSPIEKLFFGALASEVRSRGTDFDGLLQCKKGEVFDPVLLNPVSPITRYVIVESQISLLDWPVDFVIKVQAMNGFHSLIIECDGHDFHERTKEQASRDRSRDRRLQEAGYPVFRFTGSEIWRDPISVVHQVIDWCLKHDGEPL